MAEGKGTPIILHGKENKFQVTLKLDELCKDKQSVKSELNLLRNENVNSALDENQNLFRKPCKSINCFQNYVGKLNEVCTRRSIRSPDYNEWVTENGEFIIQCKMFDNSVTQGQSRSKKDAKHKAAEAMLRVLNEREEARCQQFSAFKESVENVSIPMEKVNVMLSSSTAPLTNHVGKLNERIKNYQKHPKYRFCGTEKGEFVIECKLCDNTITRGQSKSKKDAKQKAAEAMLLVLNQASQNKREESMCSNHPEFIKPSLKPFEDHVGNLNKDSSTIQIKQSSDKSFGTEKKEFINRCKIIDNTSEQPKFIIDVVEPMVGTLNDNEDSRKDEEESQCQRYVEIIKRSKNLTKSILSSKENININSSSSVEPLQSHVDKFNKTKNRKESMNDGEKPTYEKDMQRHVNLTENGSIRLSAPTDPSNEMYYKSKKKYLSKRACKTDHREKYKIFKNTQDSKPKADKAMLSVLNNSDEWKNDGKALPYISNKLIVKNIPNSTLNLTANENFRLSLEQYENHIEAREETYYKNKKKHLSHRVCRKPYSGESRYQKHAKVTELAKNLTNPTLNATGNVSDELRSSAKQFENHIGKLNETFYKSKKHFLPKACYRIENDELSEECNIFENTVTQEQSKIKNGLKPKASVVLLDLLSDSETSRSDREESIRQKHMEFYKCARNFPISSLNVRKNGRFRKNSRTETFENYVKELNEEYGKKIEQRPWYRVGGTKNGEYITECIINNTITRGQSRYKKEAKQKAAKKMIKTLAGSGKMKRQRSLESLEEYQFRGNQRKLLIGLDTDSVALSASPNKSSNSTKSCQSLDNTSSVQFENYVGKLNEICFKETLRHPLYTTFKLDSGEFIIKCEMFDKTCSHGRSTTKKQAKQKAAKAMIEMIIKNLGKYQRQQDTKSPEFISNVTEKKNACRQADMSSSSTDENDNLEPFENHVGKLNNFCIKRRCEAPTYIEHFSENRTFTYECKVINDTVVTVTWGRSMLRKDAKQKAAQEMLKILVESSKLERRSLMTSVTIIDTTDYSQQKSMEELNNPITIKQSDWSSLDYMNEQELKLELKDLNISYNITSVKNTSNAMRLKTKRTKDFKSLTFISIGESRLEICLNLLRKAVFGLRILKK